MPAGEQARRAQTSDQEARSAPAHAAPRPWPWRPASAQMQTGTAPVCSSRSAHSIRHDASRLPERSRGTCRAGMTCPVSWLRPEKHLSSDTVAGRTAGAAQRVRVQEVEVHAGTCSARQWRCVMLLQLSLTPQRENQLPGSLVGFLFGTGQAKGGAQCQGQKMQIRPVAARRADQTAGVRDNGTKLD